MPTITFRVNLETPLRDSYVPVTNLRTEGDNLRETRSTWSPDDFLTNRKLAHGDEFTVSGPTAVYLRDNYTTGDFAVLTVVSEGLTFSEEGEIA